MPVLTVAPTVFTPGQETRLREIVREEIQAWYTTSLPGLTDRDGKPYSPRLAFPRGVWAYDQAREGGFNEKRLDVLEAAEVADAAGDAAEAAEQDQIVSALQKPILP